MYQGMRLEFEPGPSFTLAKSDEGLFIISDPTRSERTAKAYEIAGLCPSGVLENENDVGLIRIENWRQVLNPELLLLTQSRKVRVTDLIENVHHDDVAEKVISILGH